MSLPSKNEVIRLILMLERKVTNILHSHLPHERRWRRMRAMHGSQWQWNWHKNVWHEIIGKWLILWTRFGWWRTKPHCFNKLHQSPGVETKIETSESMFFQFSHDHHENLSMERLHEILGVCMSSFSSAQRKMGRRKPPNLLNLRVYGNFGCCSVNNFTAQSSHRNNSA